MEANSQPDWNSLMPEDQDNKIFLSLILYSQPGFHLDQMRHLLAVCGWQPDQQCLLWRFALPTTEPHGFSKPDPATKNYSNNFKFVRLSMK